MKAFITPQFGCSSLVAAWQRSDLYNHFSIWRGTIIKICQRAITLVTLNKLNYQQLKCLRYTKIWPLKYLIFLKPMTHGLLNHNSFEKRSMYSVYDGCEISSYSGQRIYDLVPNEIQQIHSSFKLQTTTCISYGCAYMCIEYSFFISNSIVYFSLDLLPVP